MMPHHKSKNSFKNALSNQISEKRKSGTAKSLLGTIKGNSNNAKKWSLLATTAASSHRKQSSN